MNIVSKLIKYIPGGNIINLAIDVFELLSKTISGDSGKKIKNGLKNIKAGLESADISDEQKELLSKDFMELQRLYFQDVREGRDIVKLALMSDDEYVRRARPKMMIFIGKSAVVYVFVFPILYLFLSFMNPNNIKVLELSKELILWGGGFLISAFVTSFTGYTVARTMDKRGINPNIKNLIDMINRQ